MTETGINELIRDSNLILEEKYVKAYYDKSLQVMGIIWDGVFF